MGEAKRKAEAGVDTVTRTAHGLIIQNGKTCVERAFQENPELQHIQYFSDAINTWMQNSSNQGFIVLIRRKDGRNIAFMAPDPGILIQGGLPQLFNEFHARMECCSFSVYVAPEFEAPLKQFLQHRHDETPKYHVFPAVKRMEHPDLGTLVFIVVPKILVERAQVSGVLRAMDAMVASADGIKKNAQRVMLGFSGYEDDVSEVFERDEIRAFMLKTAANAPWWPILAHPDTFMLWFAGILDYSNLDKGADGTVRIQCDPEMLKKTINESLPMVSMLLNSSDIDDESINVILSRVIAALSAFVEGKSPDILAGASSDEIAQGLH